MPQWFTLADTPIILSPNELATDEGWRISGSVAFHDSCFPGVIIRRDKEVTAGETWVVEYIVETWTSGVVYPVIAGISGTPVSSTGKKTDSIAVPDGATDLTVKFYSDGELGIRLVATYPVLADPNNAVTLGFNAADNKWTTYYAYEPGFLLKFVNDLFLWSRDGRMWKANSNETRNLFFGEQSYSEVQIIVNIDPLAVKNFCSMRVNSNKAWAATSIYIRPIYGKENGQTSRLKKGNFVNLNGAWFADFLKDLSDPRFNTELEALFNGADLQGNVMSITLRNDDTTEVRMVSADILGAYQQFTYGAE